MILKILIGIMSLLGLSVLGAMGMDIKKHKGQGGSQVSSSKSFIMGLIANFCDALGVGSFAVFVTLNRFLKQIPVKLLVGTLVVGVAAIPTIVSMIYSLTIIDVDTDILVASIIAGGIGTFVGAKIMSGFSEKKVRIVLGLILFIVGLIQLFKLIHTVGAFEGTTGLSGIYFLIAVIGLFIIGILQGMGLGFFAPTLALLMMLGMSSKSIYPIMFAGCAAGVLMGSFEFIKKGAYERKASPFIAIGGVIGVIIAVTLVKSLPITAVNWIVTLVLLFVGGEMFMQGIKQKKETA